MNREQKSFFRQRFISSKTKLFLLRKQIYKFETVHKLNLLVIATLLFLHLIRLLRVALGRLFIRCGIFFSDFRGLRGLRCLCSVPGVDDQLEDGLLWDAGESSSGGDLRRKRLED